MKIHKVDSSDLVKVEKMLKEIKIKLNENI